MWVKSDTGDYINTDHLLLVTATGSGSSWSLQGTTVTGQQPALAGNWASQAAAQEAARELIDGVDSSTFGD